MAQYVAFVPMVVPLPIDVDGHRVGSETLVQRLGGYVVAIATVIADEGLAVEVDSTYVGHPQTATLSAHLLLGLGAAAQTIADVHQPRQVDPLHEPSACLYDHAMRVQDFLVSLGHDARLHVEREAVLAVQSV